MARAAFAVYKKIDEEPGISIIRLVIKSPIYIAITSQLICKGAEFYFPSHLLSVGAFAMCNPVRVPPNKQRACLGTYTIHIPKVLRGPA